MQSANSGLFYPPEFMKHKKLRFGIGFHVSIGNPRSQAAEMVLEPGETEGDSRNHHKGADQWLYVVSGAGVAIVAKKRIKLVEGTLLLIEKGNNHEIRNTGTTPLKTLNIYLPPAYTKSADPLPPAEP
jgi:mannose-6-phosphate isomerase-like protein (cupin superfamily)